MQLPLKFHFNFIIIIIITIIIIIIIIVVIIIIVIVIIIFIVIIWMCNTVLTVNLCSWGPVTTSLLKPFGGFEQCVGGQFSATLLSKFQYLFLLNNFLTLWVLFLGLLLLITNGITLTFMFHIFRNSYYLRLVLHFYPILSTYFPMDLLSKPIMSSFRLFLG